MKSPRSKQRSRFFDVHVHKPKRFRRLGKWFEDHRVINLKPTFYRRYQFRVIFALVMIGAGLFFAQKLFTRAEVADFHPATCLGEWQNPHLAQGEPENLNAGGKEFSEGNASIYAGGSHKVFCGNFVPENFEERGDIKNVGLTLVWQVGERVTHEEEQPAPTATLDVLPPTDGGEGTSTPPDPEPVPTETPPPPETEPQPQIIEEPPAPINETTTVPISGSLRRTFSQKLGASPLLFFLRSASAQEAESGEGITEPPPDAGGQEEKIPPGIDAPPRDLPAPPAEQIPPTDDGAAGNTTSSSSSTPDGAEENGEADAATPTSTIPEPVLENPPDEHFLKVTYSLDGQAWEELARVHEGNWEFFTVAVPIVSWADLRKLQVGIEGIDTALTAVPNTYLDGMLVEVHYEIPPPILSPESPEAAPETSLETAEKPEIKTFDPEATHTCSVEPFAQNAKKGGAAVYQIALRPSREPSPFELQTGDLPTGVSAAFDHERGVGTSTPRLTLNVNESATTGSFNVVVVYREIDNNLDILSNFCQLNLIVE